MWRLIAYSTAYVPASELNFKIACEVLNVQVLDDVAVEAYERCHARIVSIFSDLGVLGSADRVMRANCALLPNIVAEGKTRLEIARIAIASSFHLVISDEEKFRRTMVLPSIPFDEGSVIERLFSPFTPELLGDAKKMHPICMKYYFLNLWGMIQESSLPEEKRKEKEGKFYSIISSLGIGDLLDCKVTVPLLRWALPTILPSILPSIIGYVGPPIEELMKSLDDDCLAVLRMEAVLPRRY